MAKGRADPEDVIVERTNGEVVVSVQVFEGGSRAYREAKVLRHEAPAWTG